MRGLVIWGWGLGPGGGRCQFCQINLLQGRGRCTGSANGSRGGGVYVGLHFQVNVHVIVARGGGWLGRGWWFSSFWPSLVS